MKTSVLLLVSALASAGYGATVQVELGSFSAWQTTALATYFGPAGPGALHFTVAGKNTAGKNYAQILAPESSASSSPDSMVWVIWNVDQSKIWAYVSPTADAATTSPSTAGNPAQVLFDPSIVNAQSQNLISPDLAGGDVVYLPPKVYAALKAAAVTPAFTDVGPEYFKLASALIGEGSTITGTATQANTATRVAIAVTAATSPTLGPCVPVKEYIYSGGQIAALENRTVGQSTSCPSPVVAPPVPSQVTATPVSPSAINLAWAASAGATSYQVSRGGAWLLSTTNTSYSDTGLQPSTTYSYSVNSVGPGGQSAAATAQATTLSCLPGAPSVTLGQTWQSVSASWTAVPTATSYNVYLSTTNGFTPGPGNQVASGLTTTSYTDNSGISPNTPYYIVVSAVNSCGSVASAQQTITTAPCFTSAPSVGLSQTSTSVSASWSPVAGANSYNVYLSTVNGFAPGPGNQVASGFTGTSFTDSSGIASSTPYYVVVSAVNACGVINSAQQTVTTAPCFTSAPLVSLSQASFSVTANWNPVPSATSYNVYVSTVNGFTPSPQTLAGSGITGTGFTATSGIVPGTVYYVIVTAVNACGSIQSAQQAIRTTYPPPTAPTNLQATAASGQISLSWSPSYGYGAIYYRIFRDVVSGFTPSGANLLASGLSTTSYFETGLAENVTHYYLVQAYNSDAYSSMSGQAAATTPFNAPTAPTGLQASNVQATSLTLSWNPSAGSAYITYNIYRRQTTGTTFFPEPSDVVGTTTGTTFNDSNLDSTTAYCYIVEAVNPGYSIPSLPLSGVVTSSQTGNEAGVFVPSYDYSAFPQIKVTINWSASNVPPGHTIVLLDNGSQAGMGLTGTHQFSYKLGDGGSNTIVLEDTSYPSSPLQTQVFTH